MLEKRRRTPKRYEGRERFLRSRSLGRCVQGSRPIRSHFPSWPRVCTPHSTPCPSFVRRAGPRSARPRERAVRSEPFSRYSALSRRLPGDRYDERTRGWVGRERGWRCSSGGGLLCGSLRRDARLGSERPRGHRGGRNERVLGWHRDEGDAQATRVRCTPTCSRREGCFRRIAGHSLQQIPWHEDVDVGEVVEDHDRDFHLTSWLPHDRSSRASFAWEEHPHGIAMFACGAAALACGRLIAPPPVAHVDPWSRPDLAVLRSASFLLR
jgi:hypothetical protein